MATSDGPGRRVGAYLGSMRNIAGSVAGLAALAATVPTHVAGPLWPVVVAGTYGAVALLVPTEKPTFVPDGYASARMRATDLAPFLRDLDDKVARYDRRLPDDAVAAYGRVSGLLHDILGRADDLATSPDDLFVVGRTITDYLPTSLQTYTSLPRDFAMGHRVAGRRTAHEELLAQLGLLEKRLGSIATALYEGDAAELTAQGRFLADKFGGSSLDVDLPPPASSGAGPGRRDGTVESRGDGQVDGQSVGAVGGQDVAGSGVAGSGVVGTGVAGSGDRTATDGHEGGGADKARDGGAAGDGRLAPPAS